MALGELGPFTLGELLDRTFSTYRKHFWVFVGIMALPQIAIVLARLIFLDFQRAHLSAPYPYPSAGFTVPSSMALMGGYLLAGLVVAVVGLLCYVVALGGTTFAVSDVCLGGSTGIGKSYQRVGGKVWKLISLMILFGLAAIGAYGLARLGPRGAGGRRI